MDVPVFSISPNPTCMYLTAPLKEAVVRFRRAIARKQGLCCILGGNGMGSLPCSAIWPQATNPSRTAASHILRIPVSSRPHLSF